MASDLERAAKEAYVDDDFELALDLYTRALDLDPGDAHLFADRAQVNLKLKNFVEAAADANKALEFDPAMPKAYLRKGIARIKLEEYQTAKSALKAGLLLAPGDSRFTKLIQECDSRIADTKNISPASSPSTYKTTDVSNVCQTTADLQSQTIEVASNIKYRHDYYNTPTEVVFTIFARGVPATNVLVEFGEQTLSVIIDTPGDEQYHFQPRLFGKIIPEKCRYEVMSSKVEIRLLKAEMLNWTSLEYCDKKTVKQTSTILAAPKSERLSCPYSKSKIDWDKLEAQVKKEEKEEKLDGDAALNKFFQDIYQDSDEDTRRAMSKSFVESNGTVLSTNWKEVGSKKVESTPPDAANILLWRDKKISAGVLAGATLIWVLFELVGYHLLTFVCHGLELSLILLFLWSKTCIFINKSQPRIPEVRISEEQVVKVAVTLTYEINKAFAVLREVALGRGLKKFLAVIAGLWLLSIVGSSVNFLSLLYILFVTLHTVPVLYEKYDDKVDAYAERVMAEIRKQYAVFDSKVLSKIPRGPLKDKKH